MEMLYRCGTAESHVESGRHGYVITEDASGVEYRTLCSSFCSARVLISRRMQSLMTAWTSEWHRPAVDVRVTTAASVAVVEHVVMHMRYWKFELLHPAECGARYTRRCIGR